MKKGNEKNLQDAEIVIHKLENSGLLGPLRRKYGISEKGLPHFHKDKKGENIWDTVGRPTWDWEAGLTKEQFDNFDVEIGRIITGLKIPTRYYFLMLDRILHDEIDYSDILYGRTVESGIQESPLTGRKEIILTLDADTKQKDLKSQELWGRIKELQKELPGYGILGQRIIKNLDKLKIIHDWKHKEGLTYKEINKKLPDIGLAELGDYQSIGTLITRYKGYVGIAIKTRKGGK